MTLYMKLNDLEIKGGEFMDNLTFQPPRGLSSFSRQTKIRSLTNDFGDGYSQSVADGLNAVVEKLTITWEGLTQAQADEIIVFFKTAYGRSFLWQVPDGKAPKRWRCIEWSSTLQFRVHNITAQLQEVFR